jgi:hypothetical protein
LRAVTEEGLVYRPEVLEEVGYLGTPDALMDDLRNGNQLRGAEGRSFDLHRRVGREPEEPGRPDQTE